MSNLEKLKTDFNPRRTFKCSHSTIEVDGVFVRVAEDNDRQNSWRKIHYSSSSDPNTSTKLLIDIEDVLQDPAIIRSARVSTGRDTKEVDEKAQGLVNYLWRDRHATPLEGGIHFRLRHETPVAFAEPFFNLFASHNEFSGRYSVLDGDYYTPQNLQAEVQKEFEDAEREANEVYSQLLGMSVAKEMARFAHIYRFITKFYMTISLRHLLEFFTYDLSYHPLALNTEFMEVIPALKDLVKCWTPWAYQAFEENPRPVSSRMIQLSKDIIATARQNIFFSDIYKEYKVLDRGSLRVVDYWGNVDVAMASLDAFPNPYKGFYNIGMTFAVNMPIPVYRQWVRHRHGVMTKLIVDYDSIVKDRMFYIPTKYRMQRGKVGHYVFEDMNEADNKKVQDILERHIDAASVRYRRLRDLGVCPDIAALNLPYTFYVPVTWSVPFTGLVNFFSLRTDSHAQSEMQQYSMSAWNGMLEYFKDTGFNDGITGVIRSLYYGDNPTVKAL